MTPFAMWLYLYSEMPKSTSLWFQKCPDIFYDIIDGFCVRNELPESYRINEIGLGLVVALDCPLEKQTLRLYQDWTRAWAEHGFTPPLLDMSAPRG